MLADRKDWRGGAGAITSNNMPSALAARVLEDRNRLMEEGTPDAARRYALLVAVLKDRHAMAADLDAIRAGVEALYPDVLVVAGGSSSSSTNDADAYGLLRWLCCRREGSVALAEREWANATACLVWFLAHEWPHHLKRRDVNGLLPLHLAARFGSENLGLFRALVDGMPDTITDLHPDGDFPLHLAIKSGAPKSVVKLLVEAEPQVLRERNASGSLPLHVAAEFMTDDEVKVLSEAYPRALWEQDNHGRLPLHRAVNTEYEPPGRTCQPIDWNHRFNVVEFLVNRYRPALRRHDKDGFLPLHLACQNGKTAVIELLAREHPGAVRCRTKTERYVPLHILAQRQNVSFSCVVKVLDLWHGGLGVRDAKGWIPLHYAIQGALLAMVRRFVRVRPSSLHTATSDTKSLPLHLAAPSQDAELVQFLADAFPLALQARDAKGHLPLHCCVSLHKAKLDVVRILGSGFPGALLEKDHEGWLPIHHAAAGSSLDVVQFLVGERPQALLETTNDGRLPLHVAAAHNNASFDGVQVLAEADGSASSADEAVPALATVAFLANASPHALDVFDMRGMRPVHVAAVHDAPLDTIYLLARMDPAAALRLGRPEAGPNSPLGRSEAPLEDTAAGCAIL